MIATILRGRFGVTPAGLEQYFAEVADRLTQGPVSMDDEATIAAQYGQEFLDRLRHWGG